jgi:hypothetical protein
MINLRTLVSNKESEQFIIAGRFNLKELLKMTLFSFLKGDEISLSRFLFSCCFEPGSP